MEVNEEVNFEVADLKFDKEPLIKIEKEPFNQREKEHLIKIEKELFVKESAQPAVNEFKIRDLRPKSTLILNQSLLET